MEKVILTADQAKAMDSIKERLDNPDVKGVFDSLYTVLSFKQAKCTFNRKRRSAHELTDEQFLNSLVYGYEIEKPKPTADGIVNQIRSKAYRNEIIPYGDFNLNAYNMGVARGIEMLESEGINFVLAEE